MSNCIFSKGEGKFGILPGPKHEVAALAAIGRDGDVDVSAAPFRSDYELHLVTFVLLALAAFYLAFTEE